jgi:NAD+ synthase
MNAFAKEEEIIEGLKQFIEQMVINSSTKGVVIGLSGGIDSAVVAYLCVQAIGKDKVTLVHLPEIEMESIHTEDAELIALELNIPLTVFNITESLNSVIKLIPELKDDMVAKGNLKARMRAVILYSIANLENKLVAGTSNKSEITIGYGTKYGDLACDFWLLGDIYKTQLYKIAEILGINRRIITKPPTAGLWANQTDEGEIGVTYEKLDSFLKGLELKKNEKLLAEELELSDSQVYHIKNLVKKNKHKSKIPEVFRLSSL